MDKLKQSVEYIKLNSRDNQNTIPKESAGLVLNEMIKEGTDKLLTALLNGWRIVRCDTTVNCFIYILKKI